MREREDAPMKTMVFGAGGWGIALSMVAYEHGHEVTLWSF